MKSDDRVYHRFIEDAGTVTHIDSNGTVHVTFDGLTPKGNVATGIYDINWFRIHPDTLVPLPLSQSGKETA